MSLKNIFKKKHKQNANSYYLVLGNEQSLSKQQLEANLRALASMYRGYAYLDDSFENELREHGLFVFNDYVDYEQASEVYQQLLSNNINCQLLADYEYDEWLNKISGHMPEYVIYGEVKYPLVEMIELKPFDQEFIERTTRLLLAEQENPINGGSDSLEEMFENDFDEVYTKRFINDK